MRQYMDSENLHRRLKKIIGQVQAIDRMIDDFRKGKSDFFNRFSPGSGYKKSLKQIRK